MEHSRFHALSPVVSVLCSFPCRVRPNVQEEQVVRDPSKMIPSSSDVRGPQASSNFARRTLDHGSQGPRVVLLGPTAGDMAEELEFYVLDHFKDQIVHA